MSLGAVAHNPLEGRKNVLLGKKKRPLWGWDDGGGNDDAEDSVDKSVGRKKKLRPAGSTFREKRTGCFEQSRVSLPPISGEKRNFSLRTRRKRKTQTYSYPSDPTEKEHRREKKKKECLS